MNRPPNILFLFPDQWRWDYLGCAEPGYGGEKIPVRTPHIDALAERGVRFTQCRTNAPICAPARSALVQGVRYHRCRTPGNGVETPRDADTCFRRLRDVGYRTMTCGKNDLHKPRFDKGVDGWIPELGRYGFTDVRGHSGKLDAARNGKAGPICLYTRHLWSRNLFSTYARDYDSRAYHDPRPTPLPTRDHTDAFCGRMALDLLDRAPLDQPWAMWVNFPGPHDPFDPPAEILEHYRDVSFPGPVRSERGPLDRERIDYEATQRSYAASCEHIDQWVGRIQDHVALRGELEHTLVIFASDHGEMLGDHGAWSKAVPEEPSVRVPLVIAGPGVEGGGRTSEALVELIDLAATQLDYARQPVPEDWDARSLGPILRGEAADASHRSHQVSALSTPQHGNWRLVCDGRWKLIETRGEDGAIASQRLHDLQADPGERLDVAAEHPGEVRRLHAALVDEVGEAFCPDAWSGNLTETW